MEDLRLKCIHVSSPGTKSACGRELLGTWRPRLVLHMRYAVHNINGKTCEM